MKVQQDRAGASAPEASPSGLSPWLLAMAIMAVACNLRPALTSVGPVLAEIRADLPQMGGATGVLTMLPVLCMGLAGPLAPMQARRWGAERVVLVWLGVLALALLLRVVTAEATLFLGTAVAGMAIGVIGVLLPGLIKRDFPGHGALMTGLFTMALCWGAAFAAGMMVPLTDFFGGSWPVALAAWALPVVTAALLWLPAVPGKAGYRPGRAAPVKGLWRHPLAWQVTLFMGLQSSLAYAVFGWLAPILRDRGVDAAGAGWLVAFSVVWQLPSALVAPVLAGRARDQRLSVAVVLALALAGLLGCLYGPVHGWSVWLWAAVLGVGQGGCFAVALTLIVLRSRDGLVAAELSGMAQSLGYTLAALCPMALGLLREVAGSWRPAGPLFIVVALLALAAGWGAGRRQMVGSDPDDAGAPTV